MDRAFARFTAATVTLDLDTPTRLPGWRVRDVLVHLGAWPDHAAVAAMAAAARERRPAGPPPSANAGNSAVLAAHGGASPDQIRAALERARADAAAYFAEAHLIGRHPVTTPVGALPATSAVHTVCYELAVHALDLARAGAAPPAADLLDAGLGALMDVTGSLAAAAGLRITVSAGDAQNPGWRFTSGDGGWWTTRAEGRPSPPHTAVRGELADLLDVSAGRANAAALIAARRLHVENLPTFLRLAPLVESVPNLPGGATLRAAGRVLRGTGGLVGRLPWRPG